MRTSKIIEIKDGDLMRKFKITQMSSFDAEEWLIKAVLTLNNQFNIDDGLGITDAVKNITSNGFNAIGKISYTEIKPLLDKLLSCCSVEIQANQYTDITLAEQIASPITLLKLRLEAFKVNFSFLGLDGVLSTPGGDKQSLKSALSM